MAKEISEFRVVYDPATDVLYLSKRKESATRGVEDKHGIVWRYASNGELIGATVMDFRDIWSDNTDGFAHELALRFALTEPQAKTVVEHVLEEVH